ncbi:hypothetical protein Bca4012_044892 [Brassica carinata]
MGKVEDKPVMAMIGRRSDLSSRATLVHGTSPRVFIFFGSKELFVNIHGLAYRLHRQWEVPWVRSSLLSPL